jgi:hypothetical protein
MEKNKNIGIWMDHSDAEIIDINNESNSSSIKSEFTSDTKEAAMQKGEYLMHNKEQQLHEAYYNEIGDEILKYDHVLLFGPTNATTELYNHLNKDLHFKDIKIDIEPSDKMSENEKFAFVRDHFQK